MLILQLTENSSNENIYRKHFDNKQEKSMGVRGCQFMAQIFPFYLNSKVAFSFLQATS